MEAYGDDPEGALAQYELAAVLTCGEGDACAACEC